MSACASCHQYIRAALCSLSPVWTLSLEAVTGSCMPSITARAVCTHLRPPSATRCASHCRAPYVTADDLLQAIRHLLLLHDMLVLMYHGRVGFPSHPRPHYHLPACCLYEHGQASIRVTMAAAHGTHLAKGETWMLDTTSSFCAKDAPVTRASSYLQERQSTSVSTVTRDWQSQPLKKSSLVLLFRMPPT